MPRSILQVLYFQPSRKQPPATSCDISPLYRLDVPCRLSRAFTLHRVISPAASCFTSGAARQQWMEKRLCSTNALHFTFVGVVATLADSVVVAEFAGYWLHGVCTVASSPATVGA